MCVCVCVCVCVYACVRAYVRVSVFCLSGRDKLLLQPVIVPYIMTNPRFKHVEFAKYTQVKSYNRTEGAQNTPIIKYKKKTCLV